MITSISSAIFRKPIAVSVYLPPCYADHEEVPYPVIYLLHGANADQTQWPDLNVQKAADSLIQQGTSPFLVIMPGGDYPGSVDYTSFVLKDLLPSIEAQYPVTRVRAGRAIGGLSIGGYWALRISFLHPDLFAAVGGYSPVVSLGYADDPLTIARKINASDLHGLSIALDVGNQDSLVNDTSKLAQTLRSRGIVVSFTMGNGGHLRTYWRAHTYDYLKFLLATIDPVEFFLHSYA